MRTIVTIIPIVHCHYKGMQDLYHQPYHTTLLKTPSSRHLLIALSEIPEPEDLNSWFLSPRIGALMVGIGLGTHYAITIVRNPQNTQNRVLVFI